MKIISRLDFEELTVARRNPHTGHHHRRSSHRTSLGSNMYCRLTETFTVFTSLLLNKITRKVNKTGTSKVGAISKAQKAQFSKYA